jgi:hypothetical protein
MAKMLSPSEDPMDFFVSIDREDVRIVFGLVPR